MKLIKIFLASSEEMDYDRMVFGNLVRRLNDVYEKRGVRLKLFEWEDYDAAFNDRRKQDEYNDKVRESDIFLALFHKKAGKFTVEEFDVASETFKEKASPKVYVYLRDLRGEEEPSPELDEFKRRLFDEMGHYWCRYDSRDSLQLQFVMQLQLVESGMGESMKVEDGEVSLDGMKVASMDRLRFAASNDDYWKVQNEIRELDDEIAVMRLTLEKKQKKLEKKRARLEEDPDDEDYREEYQEVKEEVDELIDSLQPKLDKYNRRKKEFADYQQSLFDTAKRVASLQGERISDRMRRAMDAFNEGRAHEANIILDEAEKDADRIIDNIRSQKRLALQSIEELLLKTGTMMADTALSVEERVARTDAIYSKAVTLASEAGFDEKKYAGMLTDYGGFLERYALYEKALDQYREARTVRMRVLGDDHPDTARSYNDIGRVFEALGDFDKALDYYDDALQTYESVLGEDHFSTAITYYNVGRLSEKDGGGKHEFETALRYCEKALEILGRIQMGDRSVEAEILAEIGLIYDRLEDPCAALEYYEKALKIEEDAFGKDPLSKITAYNKVGRLYHHMYEEESALEYYEKALKLEKHYLGENHPSTARTYKEIGEIHMSRRDYEKALEYCEKALGISEKVFGDYHLDTLACYSTLGDIYSKLLEDDKALAHYEKALMIRERIQPENHPDRIDAYDRIGDFYGFLGEREKALEYYGKALDFRERYYDHMPSALIESYIRIGDFHSSDNEYEKALKYYLKALKSSRRSLGRDHPYTATMYDMVASTFAKLHNFEVALKYKERALSVWLSRYGEDSPDLAESYKEMGLWYGRIGNHQREQEYTEKALRILASLAEYDNNSK